MQCAIQKLYFFEILTIIIPKSGNGITLWRPENYPSPPCLIHVKLNSTCSGVSGEFWFSNLHTRMPFLVLDIMGTFYAIALWSSFEMWINVIIQTFPLHLGWDHVYSVMKVL